MTAVQGPVTLESDSGIDCPSRLPSEDSSDQPPTDEVCPVPSPSPEDSPTETSFPPITEPDEKPEDEEAACSEGGPRGIIRVHPRRAEGSLSDEEQAKLERRTRLDPMGLAERVAEGIEVEWMPEMRDFASSSWADHVNDYDDEFPIRVRAESEDREAEEGEEREEDGPSTSGLARYFIHVPLEKRPVEYLRRDSVGIQCRACECLFPSQDDFKDHLHEHPGPVDSIPIRLRPCDNVPWTLSPSYHLPRLRLDDDYTGASPACTWCSQSGFRRRSDFHRHILQCRPPETAKDAPTLSYAEFRGSNRKRSARPRKPTNHHSPSEPLRPRGRPKKREEKKEKEEEDDDSRRGESKESDEPMRRSTRVAVKPKRFRASFSSPNKNKEIRVAEADAVEEAAEIPRVATRQNGRQRSPSEDEHEEEL